MRLVVHIRRQEVIRALRLHASGLTNSFSDVTNVAPATVVPASAEDLNEDDYPKYCLHEAQRPSKRLS